MSMTLSQSKPLSPELPLQYRTPDFWAEQVLQEMLALLSDHAYLERKAVSMLTTVSVSSKHHERSTT